jgi:adenosylcobinamide-phosphate synthase
MTEFPMTDYALTTTAGYALDLWLGDPRWMPHPVRGIGRVIRALEAALDPLPQRRLAGCALVAGTVGVTALTAGMALRVSRRLGPRAEFIAATLLTWTALATRDLADHAMRVECALTRADIEGARAAVGLMVSRETAAMDGTSVARACVESVAENLVDGSVSPLLYALAGGPVLVWIFKAVSTLDSMVGYRSERYADFGWASARADDLLNWLPARLTGALMPPAAALTGGDAVRCFQVICRDGGKNPSPNSGIAEAAMAGALGVELGGENRYGGVAVLKPRLNQGARPPEPADIRRSRRTMIAASLLSLAAALAFRALVRAEARDPSSAPFKFTASPAGGAE